MVSDAVLRVSCQNILLAHQYGRFFTIALRKIPVYDQLTGHLFNDAEIKTALHNLLIAGATRVKNFDAQGALIHLDLASKLIEGNDTLINYS